MTIAPNGQPSANDIGRVVSSSRARTIIYGTYVVLLVVAGAITIGFAALQSGLPDWALVMNAVLGYLGIPVGGLAVANVAPKAP